MKIKDSENINKYFIIKRSFQCENINYGMNKCCFSLPFYLLNQFLLLVIIIVHYRRPASAGGLVPWGRPRWLARVPAPRPAGPHLRGASLRQTEPI